LFNLFLTEIILIELQQLVNFGSLLTIEISKYCLTLSYLTGTIPNEDKQNINSTPREQGIYIVMHNKINNKKKLLLASLLCISGTMFGMEWSGWGADTADGVEEAVSCTGRQSFKVLKNIHEWKQACAAALGADCVEACSDQELMEKYGVYANKCWYNHLVQKGLFKPEEIKQ
jgi:hypothetical protein